MRGTFTLEFETEAERRKLWGEIAATGPERLISPIHLSVILTHKDEIVTGQSYYFKLDMPEIYLETAPASIRREQDRVLQAVNFRPVLQPRAR